MSIAMQEPTQSPPPSGSIVRPLPAPVALLVEHVTKRFKVDRRKPPVVAVDDVSIRMERGEIYGLLGANGSGPGYP
jgi:ABC-type glutathione transport system ATPase component